MEIPKMVFKAPDDKTPRGEVRLAAPRSLHHDAYVTHDVEATVDFYTRVLGMELISTVIDSEVPSTGDPYPYIHIFFALGDGSSIAFFEALGLPAASAHSHPAYAIFDHLALDVGSREEVDRWAERLTRLGVKFVGPVDHKIIYSVYFYDPNGIRLELTADVDAQWKDHGAQARRDLDAWSALKRRCRDLGEDEQIVRDWIVANRRRHRGGVEDLATPPRD
jgi:catechol 2,3-dioxygenase-like lactoylglutathione lyase family enzyme